MTERLDGFDERTDSVSWAQILRYVWAPIRRPFSVIAPWVAVLALSVAALFVLPKRYRSSTLILIESDKVPATFVQKVATTDRTRSLDAIRSEVLSRTRLEQVLAETQPYPEIESKTVAVETMRKRISVNASGADGLTIEFVHSSPYKAQEVADRVANLFIGETVKARQSQVEGAVDFLNAQVVAARRELEVKDEAMRRYKETRMGRLPEQLQTNLATMSMLQQELRTVEETLLFARERQQGLARGASRPSSDPMSRTAAIPGENDLTSLRNQLTALRARYTDEHPDVQSMRVRIARLESRVALASSGVQPEVPDAAQVTREQLDLAKEEVVKLEARRADLESRIAALRARIEDTPRTEQELANLNRDYQKLNENYTALLSKQLEAQMAGRLEERWKGDRFRILDPANLPEKPYFPRKTLVLGFGAVIGLLVGLGTAVGAEYLDPTIKDSEDLEKALDIPLLARIHHIPELDDIATS